MKQNFHIKVCICLVDQQFNVEYRLHKCHIDLLIYVHIEMKAFILNLSPFLLLRAMNQQRLVRFAKARSLTLSSRLPDITVSRIGQWNGKLLHHIR